VFRRGIGRWRLLVGVVIRARNCQQCAASISLLWWWSAALLLLLHAVFTVYHPPVFDVFCCHLKLLQRSCAIWRQQWRKELCDSWSVAETGHCSTGVRPVTPCGLSPYIIKTETTKTTKKEGGVALSSENDDAGAACLCAASCVRTIQMSSSTPTTSHYPPKNCCYLLQCSSLILKQEYFLLKFSLQRPVSYL